MLKMLLDPTGGIVMTNDGNAILREVDVSHPGAKSMVELSRAQDEEVGDGTTSVIVIAGEMLHVAEPLLLRDFHPTVICSGFLRALDDALVVLKEIAFPIDLANRAELSNLVRSSIGTKFISRFSEQVRAAAAPRERPGLLEPRPRSAVPAPAAHPRRHPCPLAARTCPRAPLRQRSRLTAAVHARHSVGQMVDLALDAVQTVYTESGGRKEIDIKRYAKVEKLPGGDIEHSRVGAPLHAAPPQAPGLACSPSVRPVAARRALLSLQRACGQPQPPPPHDAPVIRCPHAPPAPSLDLRASLRPRHPRAVRAACRAGAQGRDGQQGRDSPEDAPQDRAAAHHPARLHARVQEE